MKGRFTLLRWRLLSSALIITLLAALAYLDFQQSLMGIPAVWLAPVYMIVAALATTEVLQLFAARGYRPVPWPVYLGTLLMALAACGPMLLRLLGIVHKPDPLALQLGLPFVALIVAAALTFIVEMQRYQGPGNSTIHIALSLLGLVYVGGLWGFVAALRLFHDNAWGMVAVISMMLVVKMCDAGAYFTGRLLGRTKMTPILSPKKTVEGAVGGVAAACLSCWACFYFLAPLMMRGQTYVMPPIASWLAYGLAIAAAGMLGDLAESLLKRDLGSKDSSNLLPGLGGVLDMVDSILFSAPVAYMFWALGFIGPGL